MHPLMPRIIATGTRYGHTVPRGVQRNSSSDTGLFPIRATVAYVYTLGKDLRGRLKREPHFEKDPPFI
eukprot:5306585-Pyramimonas_sp.AAC.1